MAYDKEDIENIFDTVLERIENGEAIRTILKESSMPSSRTFFKWLNEDDVKVKQYACACEKRADTIFEDILTIADEENADVTIVDGAPVVVGSVVQRSRLKIDARKWMLSKMNPKKYSDKIQVDTTDFKEQPLFPDVPTDNSDK